MTCHNTKNCSCSPTCETGLRNNYFEGKRLSVDSYRSEQKYSLDRRRLLNRAIHGWGVVYGYRISSSPQNECKVPMPGKLQVGSGLALDLCGRELLNFDEILDANAMIFLDDQNHERPPSAGDWILSVHYVERLMGHVDAHRDCHCGDGQWNFTCETVCFTLKLKSNDNSLSYCGQSPDWNSPSDCHCLVSKKISNEHVKVDLRHGIPLACVTVYWNADTKQWVFQDKIKPIDPQPHGLVRENLTRICDFGWKAWHRSKDPVSFEQFSQAFYPSGTYQEKGAAASFTLEFSRPVRTDTLLPDCFAMTIMIEEREGGWWQTYRVPIVKIVSNHNEPKLSAHQEYVRSVRIEVDDAWLIDAVRGKRTLFYGGNACVEIEVRGDFIIDCNGLAVDGNANGLMPVPSGNGTPGGTFLSTFLVKQPEPSNSPKPSGY